MQKTVLRTSAGQTDRVSMDSYSVVVRSSSTQERLPTTTTDTLSTNTGVSTNIESVKELVSEHGYEVQKYLGGGAFGRGMCCDQ